MLNLKKLREQVLLWPGNRTATQILIQMNASNLIKVTGSPLPSPVILSGSVSYLKVVENQAKSTPSERVLLFLLNSVKAMCGGTSLKVHPAWLSLSHPLKYLRRLTMELLPSVSLGQITWLFRAQSLIKRKTSLTDNLQNFLMFVGQIELCVSKTLIKQRIFRLMLLQSFPKQTKRKMVRMIPQMLLTMIHTTLCQGATR